MLDNPEGGRPGSPSVAKASSAGLLWGAVGVLAFSLSLPLTRLAIAGGLTASFVGIGRAVVSGLLALATLAAMRQPLPAARLLPRLAVVGACVVLGFPLLTALALARVPAAHGIVVTGLLPAATAVAAVLRAGERPSLRFWLAALAGVACVIAFAAVQGAGRFEPADALLLAAVLLCGLGYAQYRSFRHSGAYITGRVFWDRQRWRVFLPAFRPAFVSATTSASA